MNLKRRAIDGLRMQRECQNFWVLLKHWKEMDKLPSQFSVLVSGPPKSYKSLLIAKFKEYWPECRSRELVQFRFPDLCGVDLHLETGRRVLVHPNGLSSESIVLTVDKCRLFETVWHPVVWEDPETGEVCRDAAPHVYDLMPVMNLHVGR